MDKKEPKIKLYVVCHKDSVVAKNELLFPIQVGAALAKQRLTHMLHDDEGENISNKNKQYCELTAHYWAWKNDDADYYGFMHYRRYFSFNPIELPKENWIDEKGLSVYDRTYECINETALSEINMDADTMKRVIAQFKIIAPIPDDMEISVYEQYKNSPFHKIEDMDEAVRVISILYPEYINAAKTYLNSKKSYFCNMFIMQRDVFLDYSEWLFTILNEVGRRRNHDTYSVQENRALAFLAERLFGVYYTHYKAQHESKVCELQRVVFQQTDKQPPLNQLQRNNCIPLVLACDNNYIKHAVTVVMSAVKATGRDNFIDAVILERNVSAFNKNLVRETFRQYHNISIRFYSMRNAHDAQFDTLFPKHYPAEITYRLLASEILKEYDKFIYLDCDVLVRGDLKELYEIDIENYYFGMAKDIDYIGHYYSDSKWQKDTDRSLGLKDVTKYYQSGVMLFNAKNVRKNLDVKEMTELLFKHNYKFPDQDLLNVVGEGHIKDIGMKWNFLSDYKLDGFTREKNILSHAPAGIYKEYEEAKKNPYIVHYCIPIELRPWHNPEIDYGTEYWKTLRESLFYEIILADMVKEQKVVSAHNRMQNGSITMVDDNGIKIKGVDEVIYINGVYIKLIQKMNHLFPLHSRRRAVFRKIGNVFIR